MSRRLLLSASLFVLSAAPLAAQQRPYTEGPVVEASYIRIKPGHFDDYMAYLSGSYKQLMEAQKKAGIITDWKVFQTQESRGTNDWDLLLTTTYKNMAALDNLEDRTDPVTKQVMGSREKAAEGVADRGEIRELFGNRYIRELIIR